MEELSEFRATRETLIETKYNGKNTDIRGKMGEAYLNLKDNQWFFRPSGSEEWYRVDGKNLSCNEENGWIKCNYNGYNPTIGKSGKAYFDEEANVWFYKPQGSKELFRAGQGGNLTFLRDKDVA